MTTSSPTEAGAPESQPIAIAQAQRGRVRWRRVRRVSVALAVVFVAIVVAGLPLYVFPPQGDPTDANLVYVIGPPQQQRIDLGETLRDADSNLPMLISVSGSAKGHGDRAFDASQIDACGEPGVTCKRPDPFTTAGEAKLLTDYVASHPSDKTVVITFTPHVARTRYIFEKCYGGDVTVMGVDTNMSLYDWAFQYAYQTAAFVKAWLTPCP
ncbi:YdcF family protein [Microbacterium testaceum]|uniref:YdcF family protein n=1 Tax=Microbacterium testaceum TaxID=2033 RepID=UPI00128F77D9|nr:YdcF family protein [Microbacterium testaceum]